MTFVILFGCFGKFIIVIESVFMKNSIQKTSSYRSPSPENVLLALLLETPRDGYQLNQILRRELGHVWHLSQSQLYATLRRLEARGWVNGEEQESRRGLPRRIFTLSEVGRQQALRWLMTPSRCAVQIIRLELPSRVFLIQRLFPAQLQDFLDRQHKVIQEGLYRLRAQLERIPIDQTYNRMAVEMRLHQTQALLDWFEKTFNSIFKGG